jgi:hypothetical protein
MFASKDYVAHQILAAADDAGLRAVTPAEFIGQPRGAFDRPYYWESDKALRRAILHFEFASAP